MAKKVEEIKLDTNKAKKPVEKKVDIALEEVKETKTEEVKAEEVKEAKAEEVVEPIVEKKVEAPKKEAKKEDSANVKAIKEILAKCAKNNDQNGYNFWSAELKKALN